MFSQPANIWYKFNIWKLFVASKHTSSSYPLYKIERHWGLLTNLLFVLNIITIKNKMAVKVWGSNANCGSKCQFQDQLDPKSPLLLYQPDITNIAVSKTLKKTIAIDHSDDTSLSSDEERPKLTPDATSPQEIFHTALQSRADLKDSPAHDTSWCSIDIDHVSNVIPNSLYLFVSVLFDGENILALEDSLKVRICSIVQDLVYTASKSRKLTPKHVGLGLALRQDTR